MPQLLQISGSRKFNDPKHSPWSTGLFIPFYTEGQIFGKLILKNWPNAKIAVLHPNDELGREYLAGLRSGLADNADTMIVKVASYEYWSPTIDSQVAQLSSSGADLQCSGHQVFVPIDTTCARDGMECENDRSIDLRGDWRSD